MHTQRKAARMALKTVLIYFIAAGSWIIFSDNVVAFFITDPAWVTWLQTYKGIAFVAASTGFFYLLLRDQLRKWEKDIIGRKQVEESLVISELRYRNLFEHLQEGVAYCQMIFENGRATDFVYLEVNPNFATLTGLKEVVGKRVSEVMPGIRESDPELLEICGRVAATGKPEKIDRFIHALQMWFEISAYSPKPDFFVAVFDVITKRKLAEKSLQEHEEQYRKVVEVSPDCIFILVQGRFVLLNAAALKLFGAQRQEELLGRDVFDFIHADFHDVIRKRMTQAMQQGHSLPLLEEKLLKLDGSVVEAEVTSARFQFQGQPALLVEARDITDRKRIEHEVQRLASFPRLNPNPVLELSRTGEILYFNAAALDMARSFGQSHPDQILPPNVAAIVSDCLIANRPNLRLETHTQSRIISWSFFPIAQTGVVHCYAGDVTERRRAEESHARLATAVEQAAESIVITDNRATILYVNPAFERTSGYPRTEAIGKNPRILKSGKHDAGFYRDIWDKLARGEVWQGRFMNQHKDGRHYQEEATISPVRDNAGKIVNYVAVKRDVTREVQLEEQFRQAQKMEAIGRLAGGVAHDFNNILAVIQMQADMLKLERNLPAGDSDFDYAAEIGKAAQRGADLTRQLLLFSRKQVLQLRELDLNEAISGITKMLQRTLGEDIQMQIKFSPQPLLVHADASMMDQILMNLTVNARDAMPKGGQLIIKTSLVDFDETAVTQSAQARPGSFVCLSITDTGCGIPPEIRPRIFDPFFTTKEVGKGTGLGLATVFSIVQQHQGWINVYSETGIGTTFRIYLPRQIHPADRQAVQSPAESIRGGAETILLVEDEASLRTTVRLSLSHLGYRVLEAPDGVAALKLWKQHRSEIRLVLTDLVMPGGVNGKELGEQLWKEDPKLKVLYVSGYSTEVAGKDFPLEEGVNFLTKPFAAGKLAKTIRNCLDQR